MSRATELADKHKGRADDCGELARAVLADRERQAGEAVAGLERCEFDDECNFCHNPQGGSFTRLIHNAEDCTEAAFYICGDCAWKAVDAFTRAASLPAPQAMQAGEAEAPSDAAREVLAAGIVHHYGVPEESSFACARRVLALATQPTASNAGMDDNEIAPSTTPQVLTVERIEAIRQRVCQMFTEKYQWIPFARAVESEVVAALASKPPAGEQKPVAWLETHFDGRTRVRLNNPAFVYDQDAGWGYKRTTLVAEQPEQVAQDGERVRLLTEVETTGEGLRYSLDCLVNNGVNTFRVCDEEENEYLGDDWVLDPVQAIDEAIRAARARGEGGRNADQA